MKTLQEMTFAELVDDAARRVHDGLLTNGGQGMRSALWIAMSTAIDWRAHQQKKEDTK